MLFFILNHDVIIYSTIIFSDSQFLPSNNAHVSDASGSLEEFLLFILNISVPCGFSQGCVSGPPQGDPPAICHEKGQSSEFGIEEPDPAGFCRARHPNFC